MARRTRGLIVAKDQPQRPRQEDELEVLQARLARQRQDLHRAQADIQERERTIAACERRNSELLAQIAAMENGTRIPALIDAIDNWRRRHESVCARLEAAYNVQEAVAQVDRANAEAWRGLDILRRRNALLEDLLRRALDGEEPTQIRRELDRGVPGPRPLEERALELALVVEQHLRGCPDDALAEALEVFRDVRWLEQQPAGKQQRRKRGSHG